MDVYNATSVKHLLPVGGEDWEQRHVYFVLDRLAPYSLEALRAAGDDLIEHLKQMAPQCTLSSALLGTHEESPA